MKLSGLFKRATNEPINFQQEDNDTFRSQKVSSKQFDKFCEVLRQAQIDPNKSTKPRDTTAADAAYNSQAVFRDWEGKIVCDQSVIKQLQQKGLMEKAGAAITQTADAAAPAAKAQPPKLRS